MGLGASGNPRPAGHEDQELRASIAESKRLVEEADTMIKRIDANAMMRTQPDGPLNPHASIRDT